MKLNQEKLEELKSELSDLEVQATTYFDEDPQCIARLHYKRGNCDHDCYVPEDDDCDESTTGMF